MTSGSVAAGGPTVVPARWPAPARVRACYSTRGGGASAPPYASFNLGAHVGDAPAAVAANRCRLLQAANLPAMPAWLAQVHGTAVADLDEERPRGTGAREADAAVTRTPGRVCALLTADCLPVLLCDRAGTVVGAAHAGWRGLADGVVEATVRAMGVAPGELIAWLGPGICQTAFEVGDEVRARFLARGNHGTAGAFRRNAQGRWQADLRRLARQRLRASGVGRIHVDRACTWHRPEAFFSHRRDGVCGRMATLIWLDPSV